MAFGLLGAIAYGGACGGETVEIAANGASSGAGGAGGAGGGAPAADALQIYDCGTHDSSQLSRHKGMLSDTELFMLGVHSTPESGDTITVRDTRSAPHVLALSAYEGAHWRFDVAEGSGLSRVILSGHESQTAEALPQGVVFDNLTDEGSLGMYGYAWPPEEGSDETQTFVGAVQALAETKLSAFAGCYKARDFGVVDGEGGVLDCSGATGLGRYVASFCGAGQPFIFATNIRCEDALANCQANADSNPQKSLSCAWGGRPIFEREASPGACDDAAEGVLCPDGDRAGRVAIIDCVSGDFIEPTIASCEQARSACLLRAMSDLEKRMSCAWKSDGGSPLDVIETAKSACPP